MRKKIETFGELARDFSIVLGVVLVWRGIWYVLDLADLIFFNNNHLYLAIGGIFGGFLILYLSDRDLKEFKEL